MKLHMMKQGSDLWFAARRGKVTASNLHRIITPVGRKYSASAGKYILELLAERRAGWQPPEHQAYLSRSVQHGVETEAEAREYYRMMTGNDVLEVGGYESDDGRGWRSPDGIITLKGEGEATGDLELKCPDPDTHAGYLLDPETLRKDYLCQCHGAFVFGDFAFVHLFSYAIDFPPVLVTICPDDMTVAIRSALARFYEEYDAAFDLLKKKGMAFA